MVGRVDLGEVDEHLSQLWLPIDLDRSQTLQRTEYAMTHRAVSDDVAERLFRDADVNGDGEIDVREFRRHLKRMIRVLDSNGDGEIDRADAGLAPLPDFRSPRLRIGAAAMGHR
jgi:Ca2+-binding EF-hand superfamily protein